MSTTLTPDDDPIGSAHTAGGAGARGSAGSTSSRVPPSLGPHGEGWVAIQVVLIVLIVMAGLRGLRWPRAGRAVRILAAAPLAAGGAALFAGGVSSIGRHLTPMPKPTDSSELRRDGAFGLVRHPMYGGVLLTAAAWGLVTSPCALMTLGPAVPFVELKRRREEAWLAERHPGYGEYVADVPHKFIPFVW